MTKTDRYKVIKDLIALGYISRRVKMFSDPITGRVREEVVIHTTPKVTELLKEAKATS